MQEPFFIPPSNRQSRVSDAHPNRNLLLKIESFAKSQLGKRYQWGANGPYAFDCSGFTKFVYEQNGISLPRISREQAEVGRRIDFDHLQKGDLIFFDSEKSSGVSHTGIYLGENRFIHASSSKKRVTISHLSGYYQKHFKWGRRVIR
jgi:cell wall-associated NlpC family hydrolase